MQQKRKDAPIVTEAAVLNTRWLLGAPASSEFLASELYKAHVEIDKLKEQLREKPSPARPRPRGRAPENCTWGGMARAAIDGSKGVWLHAGECCMRLECRHLGCVLALVRHPPACAAIHAQTAASSATSAQQSVLPEQVRTRRSGSSRSRSGGIAARWW